VSLTGYSAWFLGTYPATALEPAVLGLDFWGAPAWPDRVSWTVYDQDGAKLAWSSPDRQYRGNLAGEMKFSAATLPESGRFRVFNYPDCHCQCQRLSEIKDSWGTFPDVDVGGWAGRVFLECHDAHFNARRRVWDAPDGHADGTSGHVLGAKQTTGIAGRTKKFVGLGCVP
jgi:hypothetical protein